MPSKFQADPDAPGPDLGDFHRSVFGQVVSIPWEIASELKHDETLYVIVGKRQPTAESVVSSQGTVEAVRALTKEKNMSLVLGPWPPNAPALSTCPKCGQKV